MKNERNVYPSRFWVKGDNGWFSVKVSKKERLILRLLRSEGIELEVDHDLS